MFKWFTLLILVLLGLSNPAFSKDAPAEPPTFTTSYNCAAAKQFVETAVCHYEELANLDTQLSTFYKHVVEFNASLDPAQENQLKVSQLAWLRSLQLDCKQQANDSPQQISPETKQCIATKYATRLQELKALKLKSVRLKQVNANASKTITQTCYKFDQPLDKVQQLPLRSYIEMDPVRDYSVSVQKGELCIAGIPHSSSTEITLQAGLKAKNDTYLTTALKRTIKMGARPQSISMGTNSYILPKMGEPLLPIKTINHSQLKLSYYRIDERSFVAALGDEILGKQLRPWTERRIQDYIGAQVWSGTLDINNIQDQEVVTQIPVRKMVDRFTPGIYILVAKSEKEAADDYYDSLATQWVVVTDIGLSVYTGEKGLSLQARSLKTAKPQDDLLVKLVAKNNMVLAEKKTSKDGWVDFSPALLAGSGGKQALYLTAESEHGDFSFIALNQSSLDLSEHGIAGRNPPGPLQTYLYTERGIYRPGEEIKLGYLLRNDLSHAQANVPLTFVLYRPDGKEAFKEVQTPDEIGGGRLNIALSNGAATGKWRLAVYSDPKATPIGETNLQVEEFVPERLEVKATSQASAFGFEEQAKVDVEANYLFGAPGSNLKVSGTVTLNIDRTPFKTYEGFTFGLSEDSAKHQKNIDEVKTDEKGHVSLVLPAFEAIDLSSPLKAKVDIEVADTDGRPSRARLNLALRTHEALVGLKVGFSGNGLQLNDPVKFQAVSVDATGNPLNNRELMVEWVREVRDYHWYYDNEAGWKSNYTKYDIALKQETVTTDAQGRISLENSFDRWGYYRVSVTDNKTGAAADQAFSVGWWQANANSPDTPDALELSVENDDIVSDGQIKGFVKAPFEGHLLVTIAQKNILWRKEIDLPKEGREFSIDVQKEWGNGAYLLVTAFRPGEQKDQRGPGRAVGAKWLSFGQKARTLEVALDLPDEILPETRIEVPVQVSGQVLQNEKVKVNVFAVDEGILRITGFKSPKPAQYLLGQQKLQLAYYDLYGRLIEPLKGQRGNIRSGGDMSGLGNQGGLSVRVFKAVALASDTIDVDKNGKGIASFDVPEFNGKLRFFAVAYSVSATGSGEGHLLVRSPLIAELLPSRFLAPGDVAQLPFRLTNLSAKDGTYKVTLEANGPVSVLTPEWSVDSIQGKKAQHSFHVQAEGVGKAQLNLRVEGPDGYQQERHWDIEVRPAQQWVSQTTQAELALANSYSIEPTDFEQFLPGTAQLSLTLSSKPEIDVQKLVRELDEYPYGCLEQTTSRVFPMLFFAKAKDKWTGVTFDEGRLGEKIREGIIRIMEKQRSDGSFGLWSRQNAAEGWLSAYAMDFLTEARKQGYDVLDEPFNTALQWMERAVKDANYSVDARAYMLMVLAKNSRFSTSNLKYELHRLDRKYMSSLGRAHIATTQAITGLEVDPLTLSELTERVRHVRSWFNVYGSGLRDFAAILSLPENIFATQDDRLSLLSSVLELAQAEKYTSTQEKSWLLQAAVKIAEHSNDDIKVKIKDATIERKGSYRLLLTKQLVQSPYVVENMQDASLFVKASLLGIPKEPLSAEANGLSITRNILDMKGRPASMSQVKTGDRFIIQLQGESATNLEHRALITDFLPAGFEIESNAFNDDLIAFLRWNKQDVSETVFKAERDDRFVAAINLSPKGEGRDRKGHMFMTAYVVRAVTPGEYVYPAPFIEDMYKPSYFARGDISRLTVHTGE